MIGYELLIIPATLIAAFLAIIMAVEFSIWQHRKRERIKEEQFGYMVQQLEKIRKEYDELLKTLPADDTEPVVWMNNDDFEEWMEAVQKDRLN